MKNYTITVNGVAYDVIVEEGNGSAAPVAAPVKAAAPKAAPAKAAAPAAGAGANKIKAPMPGKILGIKVNVGDAVKKGQVIMILEAMKMENEIVADVDGKVASIDVQVGSTVEADDVLASLN
ncbi:MAG: biotin/lipoyl-binding protein [Lachnospiraceae bacterium]|nr:biotin/lipoyl-binding protein [Lachnospiraceae bacterium]